jgi:hypothetical protein
MAVSHRRIENQTAEILKTSAAVLIMQFQIT